MPAPTVNLDDIRRQMEEEYGDEALKELSEEDAEHALLSRFLFAPPLRQVVAGERNGLPLDRVIRQLRAFFTMIAGRKVDIAYSDPPATDNVSLFLPKAQPAPEEATDLLIYRVMGLVQLGFARWGLLQERSLLAEIHRDWVLRSAWHLLAARYVLRRWAEEYPGLAEDVRRIPLLDKAGIMRVNVTVVPRDGMPGAFVPLYDGLTTCLNWRPPGAEGDPARQAVAAVDRHAGPGIGPVLLGQARRLREHFRRLRLGPPPLPLYVGIIRPEWILADLARDLAAENEWKKGNKPLRQLMDAIARKGGAPGITPPADTPRPGLRQRLLARISGPTQANAPAYGKARDEHAEEQRESRYGAAKWEDGARPEALTDDTPAHPTDDGGREYDEWDDAAGVYRIAATRVYEPEAPPGPVEGWSRIVEANRRQIAEIRRKFEQLRVEERWLHGQADGTDLDLNRAILALTDVRAGQQPDDRVWKRFVRARQQVAILTMVDLSGSTQGHVIHLEQEALILLAEGLRTLGFPHAFYGFGNTHPMQCQFWRIKGFDEPWGEPVHKRLGNLRPNGATRLGAFIRHGGAMLARRPEPRRVLFVVSDGRPEDRNEYRGRYGVRDTAMAVTEVQRLGVHPHCVSLDDDDEADRYLGEIFGKGRFLRLANVDSLPARLPEVFRGLVR